MNRKSEQKCSDDSVPSEIDQGDDQSKRIFSLMYLGKRGGGAQLTSNLYHDLHDQIDDILLILAEDVEIDLKKHVPRQISNLPGIHSITSLICRLLRFIRNSFRLGAQLKKFDEIQIFIVMIHPLDRILLRIIKFFNANVNVTVILHEIDSRDRRKWPSKLAINFYLKHSDKIIFLSKELQESQIVASYIQKTRLARLTHKSSFEDLQNPFPGVNYILCIGRNEPYKDLNLLIEAWNLLQIENYTLVIAGEDLPKMDERNLIVLSEWLDSKKFSELIKFSKFMVLPYKNATQSGVLALAEYFNKTCVITPVTSLIEQAGGLGIVTHDFTSGSLANSILKATHESETGVTRRSHAEGNNTIKDVVLENFRNNDL